MERQQKVYKITRWMRYHHFNTHPAKESHQKYIGVLTLIEGVGGFNIDDYDLKGAWHLIRHTIKRQLLDTMLDTILRQIKER